MQHLNILFTALRNAKSTNQQQHWTRTDLSNINCYSSSHNKDNPVLELKAGKGWDQCAAKTRDECKVGFTHSCQTWEDRHVRPWGNPPAAWDILLIWSVWGKTHPHIPLITCGKMSYTEIKPSPDYCFFPWKNSPPKFYSWYFSLKAAMVFFDLASDISGVILPPSGHIRSRPSLVQIKKPVLKNPPDSVIQLQPLSIYAI